LLERAALLWFQQDCEWAKAPRKNNFTLFAFQRLASEVGLAILPAAAFQAASADAEAGADAA